MAASENQERDCVTRFSCRGERYSRYHRQNFVLQFEVRIAPGAGNLLGTRVALAA